MDFVRLVRLHLRVFHDGEVRSIQSRSPNVCLFGRTSLVGLAPKHLAQSIGHFNLDVGFALEDGEDSAARGLHQAGSDS